MKPIVALLAAVVAVAGLSGCRPDQEYRLAEACRESATFILAPQGNALEETCNCLAKSAVQQLDADTVEYMITMLEDQQPAFSDTSPEGMARLEKVVDFQLKNTACMRPLTLS